jgi:Cof subfamily protein (haloacid dehalogenase superfamily)
MTVFCSDIDGTLLNSERTLSARTIHAIRDVRDAGHNFVLCSSRMPSSMRNLELMYGGNNAPLIAYNGGLVLSASGDVVRNTPISPSAAIQIYELCDLLGVHGSFYSGDDWYVWADDRWAEREINNTGVRPRSEKAEFFMSSGAIAAAPPHKIMCMGDELLIDQVEVGLSAVSDVVTYRSRATYLEIANAECDKGSGLRAVSAELGVDAGDCYFFGDNYNDLPAFAVVGTSIAVANAKESVLAAATVVTAASRDDGVARYLESWLAESNRV